MEKEMYELMRWGRIEGIVYSDEAHPCEMLGAKPVNNGKTLVQAFLPDAKEVFVVVGEEEYRMELVDGSGFFATLLPIAEIGAYYYRVVYENGEVAMQDAYRFPLTISDGEMQRFEDGIHYELYQMLGAHPMTIDGVEGVRFAVWAPEAIRVSVVGDFNFWDGRRYMMHKHDKYGIFELFIPGLSQGTIYKYELKVRGGLPVLKSDPFAFSSEKRPNTASVVFDSSDFAWKDKEWLKKRETEDTRLSPMSVYEVHLGSFKKPEEDASSFYNYRELAVMIADYVKKMGYTHIELLPVMEHPFDGSWGYQVTGYYSPTSRYGTPADFKYFVNYMHEKGIGVILDWVPAHFPRDTFGLAQFDGTCLFEHYDPRQGSHPHWGTLIFNYGRPQVSNFLIANAMYWVEQFHADGIRIDAVASMLYLDYGKEAGGWIPNKYGGKENLEAIELFKHMNSMMKKRNPGVLMIAEESTAWPKVTGEVEDGGLGFDYKWNMGWMNDFTNYMKTDPLFRKGNQGALTFSIMYAHSENFMLVLSHDEVVHGKASMINKMPGTYEQKFANLRVAYGYMMTHPGKKLLFMGQDFAQFTEWNEAKSLEWGLVDEYDTHRKAQEYYKALNKFYGKHPAMYEGDYLEEGFEWIDCMDANNSIITFLRRSKDLKEQLLVVCNFTPNEHEGYRVGVPFAGKFKEVFNSEDTEFGGTGKGKQGTKKSEPVNWNNRDNSITLDIPGLSMMIFACEDAEAKKAEKAAKAEKKTAEKKEKAAEKKAEKAEKAVKVEKKPAEKKEKAEKAAKAEKKPAEKKEKTAEKKVKEEKAVKAEKKTAEKKEKTAEKKVTA